MTTPVPIISYIRPYGMGGSHRDLLTTFAHSAAWHAATRVIYSLPGPLFVILLVLAGIVLVARRLRFRRRPTGRRAPASRPTSRKGRW